MLAYTSLKEQQAKQLSKRVAAPCVWFFTKRCSTCLLLFGQMSQSKAKTQARFCQNVCLVFFSSLFFSPFFFFFRRATHPKRAARPTGGAWCPGCCAATGATTRCVACSIGSSQCRRRKAGGGASVLGIEEGGGGWGGGELGGDGLVRKVEPRKFPFTQAKKGTNSEKESFFGLKALRKASVGKATNRRGGPEKRERFSLILGSQPPFLLERRA